MRLWKHCLFVTLLLNCAYSALGVIAFSGTAGFCPSAVLHFPLNSSTPSNQILWSPAKATLHGGAAYNAGSAATVFTAGDYVDINWVEAGTVDTIFSVWFRVDTLNDFANIFSFGQGAVTSQYVYAALQTASNGVRLGFGTSTLAGARTEQTLVVPNAFIVGTWTHLSALFLANNTIAAFINGTRAGVTTTTSALQYANFTTPYVGKSQISTDGQFVGAIASFSVYLQQLPSSYASAYSSGCPAFIETNGFSAFVLGADAGTTVLAPNISSDGTTGVGFVGQISDFQLYNYDLLKGTGSCAPAPPPRPPMPPSPPPPPRPPPSPPNPPSFSAIDAVVSATIQVHIAAGNSLNAMKWTWGLQTRFQADIAYLFNVSSALDVLVTDAVDGGTDDNGLVLINVGTVVRDPLGAAHVASLFRTSKTVLGLPASTTYLNANGFAGAVASASYAGPNSLSTLPGSAFPSAATSIVLNGTSIDKFDFSDAKALAGAIGLATGFNSGATFYVTGVYPYYDAFLRAYVPTKIVVGIAAWNANATGAIDTMLTLLPSPSKKNRYEHTQLINAVSLNGLPAINRVDLYENYDQPLTAFNESLAYEFATVNVLVDGLNVSDFTNSDIVAAEFSAVVAKVLDASSAAVGVLGAKRVNDTETLVGLSLSSNRADSAAEVLTRFESKTSDEFVRRLAFSGLPEITRVALQHPTYLREAVKQPPPAEFVVALTYTVTTSGYNPAPGLGAFGALISDLGGDLSIPETEMAEIGFKIVSATQFKLGVAIKLSTLAAANAAVTAIRARNATKAVVGLPQVTSTVLSNVCVGKPTDLSTFTPPGGSVTLKLTQSSAVPFLEFQRRAFVAAVANFFNVTSDRVSVADVSYTATQVTLGLAVPGTAPAALLAAMSDSTAPENTQFVTAIAAFGFPHITKVTTANNQPGDALLMKPFSTIGDFYSAFNLQFNGIVTPVQSYVVAAAVAKALGRPASTVAVTPPDVVLERTTSLGVMFVSENAKEAGQLESYVLTQSFANSLDAFCADGGLISVVVQKVSSVVPAVGKIDYKGTGTLFTFNLAGSVPAPFAYALLPNIAKVAKLSTTCCEVVNANTSVVSVLVNSDTVTISGPTLAAAITANGIPQVKGLTERATFRVRPQPDQVTYGIVLELRMTVRNARSVFNAVEDAAFLAVLCASLQRAPGCAGITGASSTLAANRASTTQEYGIALLAQNASDAFLYLSQVDQAIVSSTVLFDRVSLAFPDIVSITSALAPAVYEPSSIVFGVDPVVAFVISMENFNSKTINSEKKAAIVVAAANFFDVQSQFVAITEIYQNGTGTSISMVIQAADYTAANTLANMPDAGFLQVFQNSGFPNATGVSIANKPQIGVPTVYNRATVGPFKGKQALVHEGVSRFTLSISGEMVSRFNSAAAFGQLNAAISASTGVPPLCIYFESTNASSFAVQANDVFIPVLINCDSTGTSFATQKLADEFTIRLSLQTTQFQQAGFVGALRATIGVPEVAATAAPVSTSALPAASVAIIVFAALGGCFVLVLAAWWFRRWTRQMNSKQRRNQELYEKLLAQEEDDAYYPRSQGGAVRRR